MIRSLPPSSITSLTSGQVLTSLTSAVKELLENSIDAHAHTIQISVTPSLLCVKDDGTGIPKEEHSVLCRKHWTSKISTFEDLENTRTMGFRGEALASLCALTTSLRIETCTNKSGIGDSLQYSQEGELISTKSCPRAETGTTVYATDLFVPLPVRHKEYIRNYKKEQTKMIAAVTAYAIVMEGVKIMVSHANSDGAPYTKAIITSGKGDMKDNFEAIYGNKAAANFIKLDREMESVVVKGYISTPKPLCGRASSDRQFLYVNKRPCDAPKVIKAINEVYRQYNANQFPVLILDLQVPGEDVDINVTPDKRTLYMHHEARIIGEIQAYLTELFQPTQSVMPMANSSIESFFAKPSQPSGVATRPKSDYREVFARGGFQMKPNVLKRPISSTQLEPIQGSSNLRKVSSPGPELAARPFQPRPSSEALQGESIEDDSRSADEDQNIEEPPTEDEPGSDIFSHHTPTEASASHDLTSLRSVTNQQPSASDHEVQRHINDPVSSEIESEDIVTFYDEDESSGFKPFESQSMTQRVTPFTAKIHSHAISVQFKLSDFPQRRRRPRMANREVRTRVETAGIQHDNEFCVQALSRQIHKADFARLRILGQFNLGFIIATLKLDFEFTDIFIIDQHAADEKFNFETLQISEKVQAQPVAVPFPMGLNASDELIALRNRNILLANGFDVRQGEVRPMIHAMPYSKSTAFKLSDLEELISMLGDNEGHMVRPSRVRSMFASRACRKSIMIGDELNMSQMQTVVTHMGEIDQPWVNYYHPQAQCMIVTDNFRIVHMAGLPCGGFIDMLHDLIRSTFGTLGTSAKL